jgi:lysophospholipase L1-like esterase
MPPILGNNATVLFQGDSVTDADRSRTDDGDLGRGYAMFASAWFSAAYPAAGVRFLNRGVGGNRARDLQARWAADCLALQPNWVSILIGINDTWRRYDANEYTPPEAFEAAYRDILDQAVSRARARLILCEPFLLPVLAGQVEWRADLDPKIAITRRLAEAYAAVLVPLDQLFAQAAATRPPAFWLRDGVHPTPAGHALIAQAWLKAVGAS